MKLQTKINLIGAAFVAVPIFVVVAAGVMFFRGCGDSGPTEAEKQQRYREIAELQKARDAETQRVKIDLVEAAAQVKRYATVEAYFSDGNPNPLTHRIGLGRYDRDVSESRRKKIIERDGGCCLVCGSTVKLEVDHRIALMNNGDNSDGNLGTLCDSCHTKKPRYDWSIKKRRRKNGEGH